MNELRKKQKFYRNSIPINKTIRDLLNLENGDLLDLVVKKDKIIVCKNID